ncbi:MAG: potassium channel protein [Bacteroidota bacterium]
MNQQLYKFVIALGLFLLSLVIGILGFTFIEDYSLVDAFYMSIITVSTVGFTEVRELSTEGRIFTSLYIIFNLGVFTYIASVLTTYLFEGELRSVLKNIMTDREISKLRNHVIVCGYGRNGSQACKELMREGREFVVIDKDPSLRQPIPLKSNFQILDADATLDNSLILAGIERASEILITTPADADNVFITLTARELKPDITIIARASEKRTESKLYRAGANHVILPDHLGGVFMAQMVTKPVVIEFLDLLTSSSEDKENYKLEPIQYEDLKPQYRDKTLAELRIRSLTGATVIAVKDNIKGMIPNPSASTFIGVDDTMILMCSAESVEAVVRTLTGR